MAHKVTIECEARFVDHLTDDAKEASDSMGDLGDAAKKAQKDVDGLGKKKAKPIFDADNNKFLKKIKDAEARAEKLGKTKTTLVLQALDKATTVIGKVLNKAQGIAGKTWSAILAVKDSKAVTALKNVIGLSKTIAGKTWEAIVKVKDYALTPLNKIKNALFNIKTLAAAVFAGFATKQLVMNPIGLADSYSSAKIGFQTLLGDDKGQKMMDDLDTFAKATPFKTSEVIGQSQKMLAMGWNAEDIITDMTTIGDAAAATGKGDEGLQRIVLALSQIKSKGKLSTEELNQLAEAGISAKRYLAEGLGYGTGDAGLMAMTEDLEKGAIGADTAVKALLEGMKEYQGMMQKTANETVEGLWSQIQDTFEINIFRKWGQGLQDGAKRGLGAIVSLLDTADEALGSLGDTIYEVGKSISNWAADKLEKAVKTIQEVTKTDAFKNANLGGKIKILWNEVIAEPFSEWWNSSGKKKVAEIAGSLGKTIAKGLTGGLLVLLGFDAQGALADGVSIGGSFVEGFLEGFDTDKITRALKEWVNNNKGLATALGSVLAFKLISGLASGINSVKGLFGGGGGSGTAGSLGDLLSSTNTMTVTAGVVNVYGNGGLGGTGGSVPNTSVPTTGTGGGGSLLTPATGAGAGVGKKLLTTGTGSATKGLLTTGTGGTAAKTLTGVTLKNGTIATTGSAATAGLAKFGVSLGSGATTAGGAAAAGAAGAAGIAGIAAGGISSIVDLFQGVKKSKSGDKKGAKDEYWSAGSKAGMMATGAGIGAAIGSVIPGAGTAVGALVGGGIGGIASLFAGGKLGKWFSDATDEGGVLSNAGKAIKTFFTETFPAGWNSFWGTIGNFFTETIPAAWDSVCEAVGTFFTETLPEGWNSFWGAVGNFFSETVPYALGYVAGKVYTFFTETIPAAWDSVCEAVGTFFTETLPEGWNSFWGAVGNFFTETLPAAWDILCEAVGKFFTETIPEGWNSFWGAVGNFFTETLPTWASDTWNNNIVPFFTESIPNFFGTLWDGVCGFFDDSIDFIAEKIWAPIKGFFTETIPGWASSAMDKVKNWWSGVKESFMSGFEEGSGGGDGEGGKARGGIVGGTSSSMEAFARGGRTDGGIVGGSTRWIRVNEESPEMIIPLSSQRRERAMKLWMKTGQLLGVPGFARGGITTGEQDEGVRFTGSTNASETTSGRSVIVEVGGINIEIKVEATDKEGIIQAIKEQIKEIAESVAEIFADEFEAVFENTPVRGGVN